jgi:hypothetical protein
MPDEQSPTTTATSTGGSASGSTQTPKVDESLKKDLQEAKGSTLKKVLLWVVGIIAVVGAAVAGIFGILYLLKGKGPVEGVKDAIEKTKNETAKADIEEKIKVAEAKNAEKAVIDKLQEIKEIDDEKKRLEELNKLL